MATEPLFEFSHIDLSAVHFDWDAVGRINPQAGDMRQINHVIWMNDECTECLGVKHVKDDEFWVDGHIPGRPLFPGVMMIEAAAQLTSVLYHQKIDQPRFVGFTRCDDTVFRGQVVPGDDLLLLAKEVNFARRRVIGLGQGYVGEKLIFETKITGMVL